LSGTVEVDSEGKAVLLTHDTGASSLNLVGLSVEDDGDARLLSNEEYEYSESPVAGIFHTKLQFADFQIERLTMAQTGIDPAEKIFYSSLAVNGSGFGAVAWIEDRETLIMRSVNPTGMSAESLKVRTTRGIHSCLLAVDVSGGITLAWMERKSDADQVYATRLDPEATTLGSIETISSKPMEIPTAFVLRVSQSGDVVATWVESRMEIDDSVASIHSARYKVGSGWQSPATLDPGARSAGGLSVAFEPSGAALVLWTQQDTGSPMKNRIYSTRFE